MDNFYEKHFIGLKKLNFYYINLERSKKRNNTMIKEFNKLQDKFNDISINYNRVDAIDGKFGNLKTKINSSSQVACLKSHLKAIQTAYDNNDTFAFICEDDLLLDYFYKNYDIFLNILKKVDSDTECIQCITSNIKFFGGNDNLFETWERKNWCTALYLITKKGMKKILETKINKNKQLVADTFLYINLKTITLKKITMCNLSVNFESSVWQKNSPKQKKLYQVNKIHEFINNK